MNIPGVRNGVRTMVFDIDGTLVESNDAHAHAWVDALTEAGFGVPFDRIRSMIGMHPEQFMRQLNRGLNADAGPGKRIALRRAEIFKRYYLAALGPCHGVRDLLVNVRAAKIECVAVTTSPAAEARALLERAGIADLIAAPDAAGSDSAAPAPDPVRAALANGRADATTTVMLGDTRYDVAAAARARIPIVALRCGGSTDVQLAGATAIYDDPAALAAALRIS